MSETQDHILEAHKAEAVQDLRELLHPGADTCEAALRIVANKWWTAFQKRGGDYVAFHTHAGAIYRHLLHYMASNVDPGEQGKGAREHFKRLSRVLVRNMPRDFWDMFSVGWHDFHTAWVQTELAAEPDLGGTAKEQAESLVKLQQALKK